jgi:hypothetical protein
VKKRKKRRRKISMIELTLIREDENGEEIEIEVTAGASYEPAEREDLEHPGKSASYEDPWAYQIINGEEVYLILTDDEARYICEEVADADEQRIADDEAEERYYARIDRDRYDD